MSYTFIQYYNQPCPLKAFTRIGKGNLKGLGNGTFYQTAGGGPVAGYVVLNPEKVYYIELNSPFGEWSVVREPYKLIPTTRYEVPHICLVSPGEYDEWYRECRKELAEEDEYDIQNPNLCPETKKWLIARNNVYLNQMEDDHYTQVGIRIRVMNMASKMPDPEEENEA